MKVVNKGKEVIGEAVEHDGKYAVSYEWTDAAGVAHQSVDSYNNEDDMHADWEEVLDESN